MYLPSVTQPVISVTAIGTPNSRQFSITYLGVNNDLLGQVNRIQVVMIRGGGIDNTVEDIGYESDRVSGWSIIYNLDMLLFI